MPHRPMNRRYGLPLSLTKFVDALESERLGLIERGRLAYHLLGVWLYGFEIKPQAGGGFG